jgi:hypothetical protein
MKYEDKEQVFNLIRQISNHQENLKDLTNFEISVIIQTKNHTTLFTIGTASDSEHQYTKQASFLIDYIKKDLEQRIENLKSMLEKL